MRHNGILMEKVSMPLPLDDRNNPLYGLTTQAQCAKLIQDDVRIEPWKLLSLPLNAYTEEDVNKAYRQLAKQLHPDRNPEIEQSSAAFQLVKEAADYMHYGLKSTLEKQREVQSISKNRYYQKYNGQGFNQMNNAKNANDFEPAFYFDSAWSTRMYTPSNVYDTTHFIEFLKDADKHSTYPENVVRQLKQFILNNKSLLTTSVNKISDNEKIIHLAIKKSNLDLFKWLIDQGADPFAVASNKAYLPYFDAALKALFYGKIDILHYLYQRYGKTPFFYDKTADKNDLAPQWWRLKEAIQSHVPAEGIRFLLHEVGYAKYLANRTYDLDWGRSSSFKNNERSTALTALMIQHKLFADLEKALYTAIANKGIGSAKHILAQKPNYDITKVFEHYIASENNSEEGLSFLQDLLASHELSAYTLNAFVVKLYPSIIFEKRAQREMALNLLPRLFARLHACQLPSKEEIRIQLINQLSQAEIEKINRESNVLSDDSRDNNRHLNDYIDLLANEKKMLSCEEKENTLFIAQLTSAFADGYETLLKLLNISKALLLNRTDNYSPLLSVLREIERGSYLSYKKTIPLLIHLGGPLIQGKAEAWHSDMPRYQNHEGEWQRRENVDYHFKYFEDFTALQLCCELNLQDYALQLIDKMTEEHMTLDDICLKSVSHYNHRNYTGFYYTALHLAIEKKNEAIALKLIEAGANYTIKAKIVPPRDSNNITLPKVKFGEVSSLEMAIDNKQSKVIRALQIKMLDDYIAKRQEEDNYLSHFSICGLTLFSFGFFDKTSKLKAASDLKEALLRGDTDHRPLDLTHQGALTQGRLGEITQLSNYISADSLDISYFLVRDQQALPLNGHGEHECLMAA